MEFAAPRINIENDDVIAVLVGCQEIAARRIDGEVSRVLTLGRLDSQVVGFARRFVDGEHGDAVVSPVRSVKEFARRVYLHFGRRVIARKTFRQRGDGRQGGKGGTWAS